MCCEAPLRLCVLTLDLVKNHTFAPNITLQLYCMLRMRDKTADFKTGRNSRFSKRNKSAVTANMHGT